MHHRPLARRLTCWLAALTLLLAGIVPGIARAVVATSDGAVIEVCTAHGSKWVHVDGSPAQPPAQQDGLHAHGDCPSCCLQAHAVALTTPPPVLPEARFGHEVPCSPSPLPPPRSAWITAQPRAPPRLS